MECEGLKRVGTRLDFLGTNLKLYLGCFVKGSNSDPSVREQISAECSATGFSW